MLSFIHFTQLSPQVGPEPLGAHVLSASADDFCSLVINIKGKFGSGTIPGKRAGMPEGAFFQQLLR